MTNNKTRDESFFIRVLNEAVSEVTDSDDPSLGHLTLEDTEEIIKWIETFAARDTAYETYAPDNRNDVIELDIELELMLLADDLRASFQNLNANREFNKLVARVLYLTALQKELRND